MSSGGERLRAGLAEVAEAAARVADPLPTAWIRARAKARSRRRAIATTAMVSVIAVGAWSAWGAWPTSKHPVSPPTTASPPSPTADPEPSPEALAACRAGDVTVMLTSLPAVENHRGLVVVFTGKGQPCRLAGYPSVVPVFDYERSREPAAHTPSGYLGGVAADPARYGRRRAVPDR